ncbi:hypothetical protein SESBI_23104 [Sesbania bispinosa]|nr:hypothetical protein SESBI_23104 [Sesbania bispinosa]
MEANPSRAPGETWIRGLPKSSFLLFRIRYLNAPLASLFEFGRLNLKNGGLNAQ